MNSGHDDRLDAVTHDLHAVLERKLGDLLGQVQAAQSLANAVKGAEDEIRRKAGARTSRRTISTPMISSPCTAALTNITGPGLRP